jgi:hypothetical protein
MRGAGRSEEEQGPLARNVEKLYETSLSKVKKAKTRMTSKKGERQESLVLVPLRSQGFRLIFDLGCFLEPLLAFRGLLDSPHFNNRGSAVSTHW